MTSTDSRFSLLCRNAWAVLAVFFLMLAATAFANEPAVSPAGVSSPNFVVIVADDLGAAYLGAYGHPVVKTPHIDQLALQGLRFDNAFLTTASCTASRASILTGRYPHNTGAPKLHDEIPAEQKLVTSFLREAGYYTAAIGKWHIGEQVRSQFDLAVDPPGDSGAEGWVSALRERPAGKPFFFWLASRDPHAPYASLRPDGPYQPENAIILPGYLDSPGARMNIAQYYTEVARLDQSVGQVLAELQRQELLQNTYVILLSDNGAPMPRAKITLYDAGIRTPLIIVGPGVVAGQKSASLVSSLDLMPTVLNLAHQEMPASMQGQSFLALLQQPALPHREAVFAEQHDHGFTINKRAVRTEDYLYIRNIGKNPTSCLLELQPMGYEMAEAFREKQLNHAQSLCFVHKKPEEELYAVKKDQYQLNNLAADPAMAGVRHALRLRLDEQAGVTGDADYFSQASAR